jgi:MFS family permease
MNKSPFYLFLAIIAVQCLLGRMVGYFMPIYFRELGFSGLQIGFYFSVSTIATILLSLPVGIGTDRMSIVKILLVSFLLMALGSVGLIFTKSYAVFCVFALIGSFGGRFYGTAINSLFFKISDSRDGHDAGLYQLTSFVMTGISMLAGSLIIAGFSYHIAFIIGALGNLVLMGVSLLLPKTETVVIELAEYKRDVLQPRVVFITLIFSLAAIHWGAETVSYGRFLVENLGLTIRQTGLYTSIGFIFVGLGAYLGVLLMRWRVVKDMQTILMIGFMLAGLFHILMCVPWPGLSFAMRLFHEVGDGMVFLAYFSGIARIFHINKVGGCAAFISLWQSVASFLSAIAFGWLGDRIGHQWPLIISGIVMTLLPIMMHVSEHKLSREPSEA